ALGGVVHLASQVSTAAFENLTEGEFFEVMAENVRSTFLVLKAAARLLSVGWVVVVAPPALDAVQMMTVQGSLERMVKGFRERFSYPRVNLVQPSRLSADPRHDQALVRTVRYLGSHESVGVSGQIFDVELPEPPQVTEALLPEVRAALDTNVRQDEDYGYVWGSAASVASDGYAGDDDDDDDEAEGEEDDVAAAGQDDDYAEYAAFDLHWSQEFGLRSGPALRHVLGDDLDGLRVEAKYAAGLEPAVDLYGDLTRLDGSDSADLGGDFEGDGGDEYQHPVTYGLNSNADGVKKRR
ncbi:MAG TPA: hypothetical protein VFD39_08400, partial [Trueperaceae bacterium]|nr:hypothetical protein [Trueperaceae bacterium]